MKVKLEPTNDVMMTFTKEQMDELGMKAGDKFSIDVQDGRIVMIPYTTVELETDDFSRGVLEVLIRESCEKDISVNDVISDILIQAIEEMKGKEDAPC
jgi:hypothetical protein